MSTEIATVDGEIIEQRAPITLFGTDQPEAVVERASAVATALGAVINDRRLYASISGKKHVQVEGWTLLGSMLGVFAEIEWSRPLENGWEARAVARTLAGNVVGAAEAMCTVNEGRWRSADTYAVRSMAQTRAVSKALRMPLGFIMHLAGYSATPAEEVPEDQPERSARAPGQAAPAQPDGELRDRLAHVAFEHSIKPDRLSEIADEVGVPKGERANADQLREIIARIEQPSSAVPTAPAGEGAAEARAAAPSTSVQPDSSPGSAAPAQPTIDDILEAAGPGAEEVPPKPGTDAYKALPVQEKANARAYWAREVAA